MKEEHEHEHGDEHEDKEMVQRESEKRTGKGVSGCQLRKGDCTARVWEFWKEGVLKAGRGPTARRWQSHARRAARPTAQTHLMLGRLVRRA